MSTPQTKVVVVRRGCSCCGCGCVLPVLMLPLPLLLMLAFGRPPSPASDREHQTGLSRIAIRLIEGYRRWLSGRLRIQCRFEPSCSTYGLEAYQTYSFTAATART